MRREDTIDLLTAISARDQRTVGEGDIAAWTTDLADVSLPEALDAATEFHRSEAAQHRRIKAADIVQWVRRERRKVVELDHARSLKADAQAARAQITSGGVDRYDGARNSATLEALHREAMRVPCPVKPRGCGQPAGERCQQRLQDGTVVSTKIPHTGRSKAARDLVVSEGETSVLSSTR